MSLSIIVAMSENNVIGLGGELPWHISEDLQRFKKLTMGHYLVMGRKTWESIGRPLPGRTSIVITRDAGYIAKGALVAEDLDDALELSQEDKEVFVVGGAQIYELALPRASRLYMTRVHIVAEGDTYFPELNWGDWSLVQDNGVVVTSDQGLEYSFLVYERELTWSPEAGEGSRGTPGAK